MVRCVAEGDASNHEPQPSFEGRCAAISGRGCLFIPNCRRRIHSGDPLRRPSVVEKCMDPMACRNKSGNDKLRVARTPKLDGRLKGDQGGSDHAKCDRSLIVALRPLSGLSGFHGSFVV